MDVRSKRNEFSYLDVINKAVWNGRDALIVFDGVCVLCSRFAEWVFRHDRQQVFLFTHAQSNIGRQLYEHFDLDPQNYETNLVIINGRVYEKMYAFFAVCSVLGFPYKFFSYMNILPRFLLDWVYDRIANNRYMIFGRRDQCLLPDTEMRDRIIGEFDGG